MGTSELIVGILGAGIGSGLMGIYSAWLQRKWRKEDTEDDRLDALVRAQKVTMVLEVRTIGRQCLEEGEISLEDKETVREMYNAYKGLGGNGHLETIMHEIDHLKVV